MSANLQSFSHTGEVVLGSGAAFAAVDRARLFGSRLLLVTGSHSHRHVGLIERLYDRFSHVATLSTRGEPTIAEVDAAAEIARASGADCVVSIGGGSAIDLGKACAALRTNPGPVLDYVEVIGGGRPLGAPACPIVAIPTTAGTGSEATRNAVITSPEHQVKVSLRHVSMVPVAAFLDPDLLAGLPKQVAAATGMDALTQLMESFLTPRATPFTDALCREGLRRAGRSLESSIAAPSPAAGMDMLLAAYWSGITLANARLGAVHGLAAALGGRRAAAHGELCATLLPTTMEMNLRKAREMGDAATLTRFDEMSLCITGITDIAALLERLTRWKQLFAIRGLQSLGYTAADWPEVIPAAMRSSSMQGNPYALTAQELEEILDGCTEDSELR